MIGGQRKITIQILQLKPAFKYPINRIQLPPEFTQQALSIHNKIKLQAQAMQQSSNESCTTI
jgi:hypothetical protein